MRVKDIRSSTVDYTNRPDPDSIFNGVWRAKIALPLHLHLGYDVFSTNGKSTQVLLASKD